MFQKVKAKRVYVEIVEQIQNLIRKGKLKSGDKLPPERILAEKLGISRAPLREAISALEILQVIESRGGKGNIIKNTLDSASYASRVKELEKQVSPFELLEARELVEEEIVGLAAEKATPEDIRELEEALDRMRNALDDSSQAIKFDIQFHLTVAKVAHNSILLQMMDYLAHGLKGNLWVNIKQKSWVLPGRPQKRFEEHTEILQSIKKGDKEAARKVMHSHLVNVKKDLLEE